MEIYSLKLLNFRNYEILNLKFSPKTNIIYGLNGMGKTNLVEAIYILGLTKTFRQGNENVVIKKGKNITKIEGEIKDNLTNTYKIIISDIGKRIKINNNKITKLSDYITCVNIVLFNPDDLKMIKDTPRTRRKILNIELSNINKEYLVNLSNYKKVLKERNAYLKALNKKNTNSTIFLDILTEQLIDIGLKVVFMRSRFINKVNEYISSIYNEITKKGYLKIKYLSEFKNKTKDQLLKLFKKNISREIIMGKTLFGPQHDDFEFLIDNEIVKEFSSEGEQKNSILAFKLAEIKIIENIFHKKPILILDDLFSKLDNEKINNILNMINDDLQVFITTTDINNLSQELINKSKIFYVQDGKIKEEN